MLLIPAPSSWSITDCPPAQWVDALDIECIQTPWQRRKLLFLLVPFFCNLTLRGGKMWKYLALTWIYEPVKKKCCLISKAFFFFTACWYPQIPIMKKEESTGSEEAWSSFSTLLSEPDQIICTSRGKKIYCFDSAWAGTNSPSNYNSCQCSHGMEVLLSPPSSTSLCPSRVNPLRLDT